MARHLTTEANRLPRLLATLGLVVAILTLVLTQPVSGQLSVALFTTVTQTPGDPPPGIITAFAVGVNFASLREDPDFLDIELPTRGVATVPRDLFEPRAGFDEAGVPLPGTPPEGMSYHWRGRSDDDSHFVSLTVVEGVLSGMVIESTGHFEIHRTASGYELIEVDLSQFSEDDDTEVVLPAAGSAEIREPESAAGVRTPARREVARLMPVAAPMSNSSIIETVMFAYTNEARIAAGGDPDVLEDDVDIRSEIQAGVDDTNMAFEYSLINVRIRAVHVERLDGFTPNGNNFEILTNLRNSAHLRNKRDEFAADIVIAVLRDTGAQVPSCGFAALQTPECTGSCFSPFAYAYVAQNCLRRLTPGHEIAHLHGCQHDPQEFIPSHSFFFAFAHVVFAGPDSFRTVVATNLPPRKPFFAHPGVSYRGNPTGLADRYNARMIELRAPSMAGYRGPKPAEIFADGFEFIDTGAWSEGPQP